MLRVERTGQFKRDYKRELKGRHRDTLEVSLIDLLTVLLNRRPLADKYRDHALTGNWKDCRDCHIKPDLVLIYREIDDDALQLVRLGSHSELSL
jgi:mRNA interferase YafQ